MMCTYSNDDCFDHESPATITRRHRRTLAYIIFAELMLVLLGFLAGFRVGEIHQAKPRPRVVYMRRLSQ